MVSQVPQTPWRQEDSTSTPTGVTASSTDTSGGDGHGDAGAGQLDLERARRARRGPCSSATNRSVRRACGGQCAQTASMAASSGPGPQAVDPDAVAAARRGTPRGGSSPNSSCGSDQDPVAVAGELVEERHRGPPAAAVEQPPVGAEQVGLVDHRQHRGDPDAAGDEQVRSDGHQREVVARSRRPRPGPRLQLVVHVGGAAAARPARAARRPGRSRRPSGRRTASTGGSARSGARGRCGTRAPSPAAAAPAGRRA